MRLPQPVPELPVSDVQAAGKSYARLMGFRVDWAQPGIGPTREEQEATWMRLAVPARKFGVRSRAGRLEIVIPAPCNILN
jgi:hypothetical protein